MGKHKDKKKSTTNTKLLFMGMGIIVGMLVTMVIIYIIKPTMEMMLTKDALLPEPSDPISQSMSNASMSNAPMPNAPMSNASMAGGRRLFKNRFR
jgi:hypothetical protein